MMMSPPTLDAWRGEVDPRVVEHSARLATDFIQATVDTVPPELLPMVLTSAMATLVTKLIGWAEQPAGMAAVFREIALVAADRSHVNDRTTH